MFGNSHKKSWRDRIQNNLLIALYLAFVMNKALPSVTVFWLLSMPDSCTPESQRDVEQMPADLAVYSVVLKQHT